MPFTVEWTDMMKQKWIIQNQEAGDYKQEMYLFGFPIDRWASALDFRIIISR